MLRLPAVPPGDQLRISATTFTTYRRCPASAEARLQGIYGPESRSSFTGALAHGIFARHLEEGPIEDVGQAAREEIGESLNAKLAGVGLKPSQLAQVIEEVGRLYARFRRLSHEGFEDAEVELSVTPWEGVELVGKIDAVFRHGEQPAALKDWKTGSLGDTEDQLRFYALLWALARHEVPVLVEAVSVATGERVGSPQTWEQLEEVAGQVAELVSVIRTAWAEGSRLARHGGPWCRHCPLLATCPEGTAAASLFASG